MKKLLKQVGQQIKDLVEPPAKPSSLVLRQHKICQTINKALVTKQAVHVIYGQETFTGDIIKYDKTTGQFVLKNFPKNLSVILKVKDIDHMSLVPDSIRQSQKIAP